MIDTPAQIEQIAARAIALYSRPTVALEVVRLTEDPATDAKTLKRCVEQDPALVCKLLRVVNSSLFGLNRPVADLNQAIGLLGIKPLKLLVLGFSLPNELFADVAADELKWYWTNTLTRAVAARLLAEQLWHQNGDEAFTAGLLQDIGILVLMRELGEPYAKFLSGVIEEQCDLAALEQKTLDFDHIQLSAALLSRWQLPRKVIEAIALARRPARVARMSPPEGDLPQILHLAELMTQIVGQRRVRLLPVLLEYGKEYRGLTRSKLSQLVEELEPQVEGLAEVLSIELMDERNFGQTLLAAHERMALLSEAVAAAQAHDERAYTQLLDHTEELSGAVREFLASDDDVRSAGARAALQHAPHLKHAKLPDDTIDESAARSTLVRKLVVAARRCRARRQELSLVIVEPNVFDIHSDPTGQVASAQVREALASACSGMSPDSRFLIRLAPRRTAAIFINCERRLALSLAQAVIEHVQQASTEGGDEDYLATTLSVGIATASVVARNFDPLQMVESAVRCMSAARASGISTTKSIEV